MSSSKRTSRSKGEDTNPDYALPGIGNYVFQKTVGEGNFAKVKLAKHKLTGQEVAIKVIDKTQLDEKKLGKLYREVRIMKLLHHPHIVRLYEVIETKSTVFLVMEYANGGELYDYLVVHGRMKEKEARAKFRQILSAVSYCHKKRVIHRDLKAENLLLDSNLDIKIADFGFSNYFDPDGKLDTFCGSPPYAAPELFQGRRYVGPEVDIWSLGVILYVLTTGCLPFDGKNLQEMRESVCRGKYRIPFYLSENCEKLLRKFLVRDPTKRASLDIIMDDPWVNEGYSESPIVQDVAMKVEEDESVIRVMEIKFRIDRETVLKSLRENIYDDVAAIYHLLYHERDMKGEHGELKKVDGIAVPSSANSSHRNSHDNSANAADNSAAHAASSASPQQKTSPNGTMARIEEDSVLVTEKAKAAAAAAANAAEHPNSTRSTSGGRHRRFTVSGEGDAAKTFNNNNAVSAQHDKDENKTTESGGAVPVEGIKKMQIGNNNAINTHGFSAAEEPREMAEDEVGGAYLDDDEALNSGSNKAGADASGADDKTGGGRKRHNTIAGIFRMRRTSNETSSKDGTGNGPSSPLSPTAGNAEEGKPRSLRFTFNSNTTSSKLPDDVVTEVLNGCSKLKIQSKLVARFLIECTAVATATSSGEVLRFEVEICKLPRLKNLHGLRFKRVSGASADYKEVCEKLLASLSL